MQASFSLKIVKLFAQLWALEAVIDERRIKVIVRQKGDGKKCFWSVIPAWRKFDGRTVNAKSDLSKQ